MSVQAAALGAACAAALAAGGVALVRVNAPAPAASPAPPRVPLAAASPVPGPTFDVVRVERDGSTLVAGRGAAGGDVTLLLDGVPLAAARGDAAGQFVILPPALPPGRHELVLARTGTPPDRDAARVAVVAEAGAGADALVALAPTEGPAEILAGPRPPGLAVSLTLAEFRAGRMRVSARAPPGRLVGLSLDGHPLDARPAGPDGRVAFDVPAARAGGARIRVWIGDAPGATEWDEARLDAGAVGDVAEGRIRVARGQTLWRISRDAYGSGARYVAIFGANRDRLASPHRIRTGQELVVPER